MNTTSAPVENSVKPLVPVRRLPVHKRQILKAIDGVFSPEGFRQCFIDTPHSPIKPNLKTQESQMPLILHIDDDVDLVDAVTARFRASGYRVACALDGISGMQSALVHPADAVVLDYDMPNGRGDVVIDLMKHNERTKDIPIVVLTAVHKKGLKRELLNRGADVFMTKPFEFNVLQKTVADLIESRNR